MAQPDRTGSAEHLSSEPVSTEPTVCSGKGCRQPATYDLQWNNPKIHTAERRKHWLACPEHRDSLSAFLTARGFLRSVETLPESD